MRKRLLIGLLGAGLVGAMVPGVAVAASPNAAEVYNPADRNITCSIGDIGGGHWQRTVTKDERVTGVCVFRPATKGALPSEPTRFSYTDSEGLLVRVVLLPNGRGHYTFIGVRNQ